MTKKIFIIGAILIGALITIHGCYTIIKHPSVMQADNTGETTEHADGNRDCVNCHQDYQHYPYGYYYGYYPGYYRDYPRWGDYYAYPWWWDYYYSSSGNGGSSGGQVEQGSKPPTRRGMEPPYASPLPGNILRDTLSPPSFNTGTTTTPVIVTPAGGTATGGTVTNPPDKPKEPAKVEDKKPPKRRGGK